jgi:hypothetical protein
MSTASEKLINKASDFYFEKLIGIMVYHLKRAPQSYRQDPDGGLANLWEEICVQIQTDHWSGWELLEDYIESECEKLFEKQSTLVQQIMSSEFFDDDDIYICAEDVLEKIRRDLFQKAMNFDNNRIEEYRFGRINF